MAKIVKKLEVAARDVVDHLRGQKTRNWIQIGKGVCQGYILSPCLFNLYAEYIMQNAKLDKEQAEIKIVGKISITSGMQMTPPLWQKAQRN